MKKIFSLFLAAILWVSACNTETQPTDPAEKITPTPKTTDSASSKETATETPSQFEGSLEALNGTTITVWSPWYGVEQSLLESFITEFNAENEWGIQVMAESQINFSGLYENTTAALPTTSKPHLVIALPEHAQEWFEEGVSVDLNPYVEDPLFGLHSEDIPFAIWNQDLAGKARVAIPAQRTANIMLWNQTWAEELKLDNSPASATDFHDQACRAHAAMAKDETPENDAMGGWLVNTDPMTAYTWLTSFNGGVVEENNYRFLTPNNIDALKFLRKLSEENCAWQSSQDPIGAFVRREALFITLDLGALPEVSRAFASENNRDTWQVLPFPNEEGGVLTIYGSSYVVLNSTEEEQLAAWLFVRWLLENEQDARRVETTHLFPLRTSTLNLLGDYEKTHPHWKQSVDLLPVGGLQPTFSSWRTVKLVVGDGFAHMYRVNVPSGQVAAILAQMETTAKDLHKE